MKCDYCGQEAVWYTIIGPGCLNLCEEHNRILRDAVPVRMTLIMTDVAAHPVKEPSANMEKPGGAIE